MHLPVLKEEAIRLLDPKPNENFIDCTFGEGGHAIEILEKIKPKGKLLGIEIDPELYKRAKSKFKEKRLILVNDSFINLKKIVKKLSFKEISGILFDLGISSWHLEESGRGFSFLKNEPLIMRYDNKRNFCAKDIVNFWPKKEIERILREFAQEKFSKKIAREIERERNKRKIETTLHLVKVIERAVPNYYKKRKIHFATKTFLALRIATNNELENLKIGLREALEILKNGGRLVVISFHSGEDKIVKNFLKEKEKEGKLKILTKKPILPTEKEKKENPKSRSAKLRAAIKI